MDITYNPVEAQITSYEPEPSKSELSLQINTLQREVERLTNLNNNYQAYHNDLKTKISNVKGYILDLYSMNGEIDEDIKEIAELLDISLTKQYAVEIHVVYRGNIEMPLDAEINDIEDHIEFSFSDRGADDWEVDIFQYDLSIDAEEA